MFFHTSYVGPWVITTGKQTQAGSGFHIFIMQYMYEKLHDKLWDSIIKIYID